MITKRERLLLIDGYNLVFRAYFALPYLSDKSGSPTNAIYGFCSMSLNALANRPDYVIVAFDYPAKTFRHIEFAAYKANRARTPDDLKPQIVAIKELVEAFGINSLSVSGFEADDVIGTLVSHAGPKNLSVDILTGDSDIFQLVSENVSCVMSKKGISEFASYGPEEVQLRYGITPKQIPDLKALKGDSSDNIPGVPGIGDKTAAKLLQQFGSIENLLNKLEEVANERIRALLKTNEAQIKMAKHLATIITDVPVMLDLESSRMKGLKIDSAKLFCQEYDFNSLLGRLDKLGQP